MSVIQFEKMQATGNDFIVYYTHDMPKNTAALAQKLCHRHFGIGADGLLLALPSVTADIRMLVLNADGSESQTCGNGLRALARFAMERGYVTNVSNNITIETACGISNVELFYHKDKMISLEVNMGRPYLNPANIPVSTVKGLGEMCNLLTAKYPLSLDEIQMGLAFVGMGNPHAIYFQDQPVASFPLDRIGPKVENHDLFPQRTNFEVARVLSLKQIEVRIWERGVGETLACGSGVCAVAVAAHLLSLTENQVSVRVPGGNLDVRWDGQGEVFLKGPAEFIYRGTVEI